MNICCKIIPVSSICTCFTPLSTNKEGPVPTTVNRLWTIQGPAYVTNLAGKRRMKSKKGLWGEAASSVSQLRETRSRSVLQPCQVPLSG